ncbi:hypothetical protein [Oscillibacter sp.]|uniref:hypothetical protein n=1 Tax=Oscillibacter sp. TaxID=1945593 RepID=UPI00257CA7F7|nr:hypothetical protein [Oscillibacter sp.]
MAAHVKADQDQSPLFGWADDGWLTLCNSPTVNHADVVNWFIDMRRRGFKIRQVGHDRKFCREYFVAMKNARFKIIDQPQYYYKKSEGFRHIEAAAKNGNLYYLHSEAYEYCVANVTAVERRTTWSNMTRSGRSRGSTCLTPPCSPASGIWRTWRNPRRQRSGLESE